MATKKKPRLAATPTVPTAPTAAMPPWQTHQILTLATTLRYVSKIRDQLGPNAELQKLGPVFHQALAVFDGVELADKEIQAGIQGFERDLQLLFGGAFKDPNAAYADAIAELEKKLGPDYGPLR